MLYTWNALHGRARSEKTTISELVRLAVRERYTGDLERRRDSMQGFVGSRGTRREVRDASEEVRLLRRGRRLDYLSEG